MIHIHLPLVRNLFDPILQAEFISFAQVAYNSCVDWFGVPNDEKRKFVLVWGHFDGCCRNRLVREYTIVIRREYQHPEQIMAATAHEMYHRVTMWRRGLTQCVWTDEMLAFLASQKLLVLHGMTDYARLRYETLREHHKMLSMDSLRKCVRKRVTFGRRGVVYPEGFGESVARVGVELEALVGWDAICRIVKHTAWNDWLVEIDAITIPAVAKLLSLG